MVTTSGWQALQLRGRSSYTGKVSSLSSLSIQHDGRSYRHVSLDGNCSEKIMGPVGSPKSHFGTESSDARRSLAASATFSRSLPRRRNSSASDAYSGEPSDLRRLPDTECRKKPREKKPDAFQESKCKEREAGVANTLGPKRRRTFPITPVFKENSGSISLLSSALDFLYLGKQKPLETAAPLPLSTLKASKSIMSRYNDFELHSGQLFKTQISTGLNFPSIHQDAHRSLPTKIHDDKAAHDFTDELKQSGMIKGDFKLLEASRIDLPVSARPPTTFSWVHLLDPTAQMDLSVNRIQDFKSFILQVPNIPKARVHCVSGEYPRILERLSRAKMIKWSFVHSEKTDYAQIADALTMTSFAIVKDHAKDRLISWPRIQNLYFPEPPKTNLPHPGHFSKIRKDPRCSLSGFFLDVDNMFHNILLPPHLASLFPLKKIAYGDLTGQVQRSIAATLGIRPRQEDQVRPLQKTLPMGFKWAVHIAHHFLQSCYQKALHSFFQSSSIFGVTLPIPQTMLLHECTSARLTSGSVLVLHIIDDLNFVLSDWPDSESIRFQTWIEQSMEQNSLPFKRSKSSPLGIVEKQFLPFIGWVWDLHHGVFRPKPDKVLATANHVRSVNRGPIDVQHLRSAIGRLVWVLLGARPLLSVLYRTFQFLEDPCPNSPTLISALKRELAMSATLSCLTRVRISRENWTRVTAFNACESGGVVVYTDTTDKWIMRLTEIFYRRSLAYDFQEQAQSLPFADRDPSLSDFISSHHWNIAFVHHWRRRQHINALEAHTAVLAVEWAVSYGITGHRVFLLSDSLVAIGAFNKGRSSSHLLCLPCPKFAALVIAHDIEALLLYVPSESNPDGGPSRLKPKAATL